MKIVSNKGSVYKVLQLNSNIVDYIYDEYPYTSDRDIWIHRYNSEVRNENDIYGFYINGKDNLEWNSIGVTKLSQDILNKIYIKQLQFISKYEFPLF